MEGRQIHKILWVEYEVAHQNISNLLQKGLISKAEFQATDKENLKTLLKIISLLVRSDRAIIRTLRQSIGCTNIFVGNMFQQASLLYIDSDGKETHMKKIRTIQAAVLEEKKLKVCAYVRYALTRLSRKIVFQHKWSITLTILKIIKHGTLQVFTQMKPYLAKTRQNDQSS